MKDNREELRFKSPRPEDEIQHKKVLASFSRDQGNTVETGIGELMVSTDVKGMSLVWIQFYSKGKWRYVYLMEKDVRLLKNSDSSECDFAIESTLRLNAEPIN